MSWPCGLVVEHLPSICEALSCTPTLQDQGNRKEGKHVCTEMAKYFTKTSQNGKHACHCNSPTGAQQSGQERTGPLQRPRAQPRGRESASQGSGETPSDFPETQTHQNATPATVSPVRTDTALGHRPPLTSPALPQTGRRAATQGGKPGQQQDSQTAAAVTQGRPGSA